MTALTTKAYEYPREKELKKEEETRTRDLESVSSKACMHVCM
jgi:hypothetical protein